MKEDKSYIGWKANRCRVEVGEDFAEKVMQHIYQYENKRRESLFGIKENITAFCRSQFVEAGLIAAGIAAGGIRIIFIAYMYLGT